MGDPRPQRSPRRRPRGCRRADRPRCRLTDGVALAFDDLVAFVGETDQIIDGLFVGRRPGLPTLARADADVAIVAASDMLIGFVDSSFCLIDGPDRTLRRLRAVFRHFREVTPEETPLSTWGRS